MNIMFLLAISLIHISYATMHMPTPTTPITCGSTQSGTLNLNYTSRSYEPARFSFELLTNSYVEISTCQSHFDTYLQLVGENVNIFNDDDTFDVNGCAYNAVIDSDELDAGQYTIVLMSSPKRPPLPGFDQYEIALQCDPFGIPTIPHSIAIPVESDCNFLYTDFAAQPLDVCSVQMPDVPFSIKYTCNSEKDGVIIMEYNSSDCTGPVFPNEIRGEGSTYYFNCDGSNDKCNLGTIEWECGNVHDIVTFVLDQCVDGIQALCDNDRVGIAEYSDNDCMDLVNIEYAPEDSGNCKIRQTCESVPLPETSMVIDECYGGCDVGFVCCDGECVRDCTLFAIDDYLLQCSDEFDRNDQDIEKLQNKVDKQQDKIVKLKEGLINVNLRIDAFGRQKK